MREDAEATFSAYRGCGDLAAALSMEIALKAFPKAEFESFGDGVFIRVGRKIYEVRSSIYDKTPDYRYILGVRKKFKSVHSYIFMVMSSDFRQAFIVGRIPKTDYFEMAKFFDAGKKVNWFGTTFKPKLSFWALSASKVQPLKQKTVERIEQQMWL